LKERASAVRRRIIRDAVVYTPFTLLVLAGWVITLISVVSAGGGSGIFLLVLVTVLLLLVGYQSTQALRDVWSAPVTTEGPLRRKWRRHEFLLFPAFYLYVEKSVFKVPQLVYDALEQGDVLAITHYPHTSSVIEVKRLERRRTDRAVEP
jgi:hypothetical protein